MAKKQPKTFERKGEFALAYSPADEVRLVYNGWSEYTAPEPAPTDGAAADTAKKAAPAKKAAS